MLITVVIACKNKQSDQDSVAIAREANKDKADTGSNIPMHEDTVTTTMAVEKADADFAVEAANGNMVEVQLGGLAKTQAVNDRVKNFAMMVIKDHMKISEDLQKIAAAKNISLPQALSDEAQNDINRLNKKDRTDFDRNYMRMVLADHRNEVTRFERASKNCKDPDLKNFINNTLPVLRKHLDSANAIDKLFVVGTSEPSPAYP
jgi:putative membrane protein